MKNKFNGAIYDWGAIGLLPIVKLLGVDYVNCELYCHDNEGYNLYTRGIMRYKESIATFKFGRGIKTEGSLIISGSQGYIYVPAPWWKPDYFELRCEDMRNNKKFFYRYEGEGFRYEILEFLKRIQSKKSYGQTYSDKETLLITEIIEMYNNDKINKF